MQQIKKSVFDTFSFEGVQKSLTRTDPGVKKIMEFLYFLGPFLGAASLILLEIREKAWYGIDVVLQLRLCPSTELDWKQSPPVGVGQNGAELNRRNFCLPRFVFITFLEV